MLQRAQVDQLEVRSHTQILDEVGNGEGHDVEQLNGPVDGDDDKIVLHMFSLEDGAAADLQFVVQFPRREVQKLHPGIARGGHDIVPLLPVHHLQVRDFRLVVKDERLVDRVQYVLDQDLSV